MGLRRRGSTCLIACLVIGAGVLGVSARAQGVTDDPGYEFQWGLPQIGAPDAWATGQGKGVTVAVLDTGVHLDHEDLADNLLTGRDCVNDDSTPQDDHGKGTHVAGIVAAKTGNGTGVAGVAPQAKILPVKILDDEDQGTEEDLLAGISYALERKVQVLLLDLDESTQLSQGGDVFREAILRVWEAGVVPVISAEHDYIGSRAFGGTPALVVTGVTRDGTSATYAGGVGSARWGLAAPGGAATRDENDIFSTYWPHTTSSPLTGTEEFGRYAYQADDIQAAAHVAGSAAILRGLGQTPQQTVDRLLSTAGDAGATGRDRTYGYGIVHAGRAVRGLPSQGTSPGAGPTTTTAPAGGGSPAADTAPRPQSAPPASPRQPAGAAAGGESPPGAPAGAASPDPTPATDTAGQGGDLVGALTADEESDPVGRTPVLPLVAFLMLVGSGAITWALRHRSPGSAAPPINS